MRCGNLARVRRNGLAPSLSTPIDRLMAPGAALPRARRLDRAAAVAPRPRRPGCVAWRASRWARLPRALPRSLVSAASANDRPASSYSGAGSGPTGSDPRAPRPPPPRRRERRALRRRALVPRRRPRRRPGAHDRRRRADSLEERRPVRLARRRRAADPAPRARRRLRPVPRARGPAEPTPPPPPNDRGAIPPPPPAPKRRGAGSDRARRERREPPPPDAAAYSGESLTGRFPA